MACLIAVLAGCGGGSDATGSEQSSALQAKVGRCEAGVQLPGAPAAWKHGARQTTVVGCSTDRVDAGASIVGYPLPEGGGSCVSTYSARLREVFDELCEPPGSRWLSQCEGPGCIHYFRHAKGYSVLDGPVEKETVGIRTLVGHEVLVEGVMHTDVQGKLFRKIGAEEPFDYFAVYIPRCVEPAKVKVELIDEKGHIIGTADKWDAAVPPCPGEG